MADVKRQVVNVVVNLVVVFAIICLLTTGCHVQHLSENKGETANGRYDSEFPSSSISESLDNISKSVKKLDCLAFYATYSFDESNEVTSSMLTTEFLSKWNENKTIDNESVSGTVTIVYQSSDLIGMITCAHVVDFMDTLFVRYDNEAGYLSSVSILVKKQLFVTGLPDGEPIEIVAMNTDKDIALLLKTTVNDPKRVNVLSYPIGKTVLFEWGSVVYIVGYPLGNLMVTRALVSNPKRNNKGLFLTDALFNHGISGSPVFAIKDGVPNLEWVGMASAASAYDLLMVQPEGNNDHMFHNGEPYPGPFFLEKRKMINYGVTYSISIEEIVTFINRNKQLLQSKGFNISLFFNNSN